MNKKLSALLAALLLLLVTVPSAKAIIMDPDDYIIYDTGNLPPVGGSTVKTAPDTFLFNAPGDKVRFILTENVSFKIDGAAWGRAKGTVCDLGDFGFRGYPYTNGETKVSYIEITENQKPPYVFTNLQWKNNQEGCTEELKAAYRWSYNGDISSYNRPSDSIIIRVPQPCDSISVTSNGAYGSYYGMIVYQKELGFNSGYHIGGNNGINVATIGFKPTPIDGKDSIDIVIMGAHKDWFNNIDNGLWAHDGQKQYTMIPLATEDYLPSERWGLFNNAAILRIKVYGEIEESVIPPFDGTIAGWDFEYLPKASGTVDLEKPSGAIDTKAYYEKYASDLGIKRFMMTATDKGVRVGYDNKKYITDVKVAQLMISAKTETDSLGGYTTGKTHNNYMQFEGKAEGCQDLSFNFDFALRKAGSTQIVVLGQPADSTLWTVLGTYDNTDTNGKTLVSVSQPLPSEYANKAFTIRVMVTDPGKPFSPSVGVSCMMLAKVALKGYDDYYTKNDDAKKVAYISNATDRVHILGRATTADSTDAFLKNILTGADYDVKVFTQEDTKNLNCEDSIKAAFKDFDMVILSEYPSSSADVVKNAKYLIGYKPFLNLKAFAYKNWGFSGYTQKDGNADTLAYLSSDKFTLHPVFNDLDLNTDSVSGKIFMPKIFKSNDNGTKYFQGVEYSGESAVNTHFIAQGINDALNCIVEDYTNEKAKYMLLAISATQNANLSGDAFTLLKNAMNYLLGSGHFEAPTFNLVSDGAVVDNTTDLTAALAYNYSVIGISNPVIYMKKSTDESNVYTLGSMTVKNSVTLKPYDSDEIVLIDGTFIPASTNTGSLTFKDLCFANNNPVKFTGSKQKLSKGLFFEDCAFGNLNSIISTEGSDSCKVATISVKNCSIHAESLGSLIDVNDCFELDSIYFGENMLISPSKQLISWQGTHPNDSSDVSALIEHNQFMYNDPASTLDFINYDMKTFETKTFEILNNIFYKAGAASVKLPADTFTTSKALNNLMIETPADWSAVMDTLSTLSLSGLGIDNPFAESVEAKVMKSSPMYRAGVNRTYLGPKDLYIDRDTPATVLVKNAQELKEALEIAIDGDVIELATYEMSETDSIPAYVLSGLALPTNGASLTIRAAEDATPVVMGNILGTSAANIGDLTISGINWIVDDTLSGYAGEAYSAAFITVKDYVIKGTLKFVNCTFFNQEKPIFRIKSGTDGTYIGKLVYKGCTIDNHGGNVEDGTGGGHLFQLDQSAVFTFNNFEFTNNIVSNYHGGQVFNLSRSGSSTEGEKAIDYNISNNLFYAFGGAAKQASNFLEFKATPAECSVDITIANNIFYERYSEAGNPVAYIQLYKHGTELSNNVVVTNNFYEGKYYTEEMLGANPVSIKDHTGNLMQQQDVANYDPEIFVTYIKQMDKDTLGIDSVFTDIENWRISTESKLYTAGVNGTFLGPEMCYTGKPVDLGSMEKTANELSVASFNGVLLVSAPEDTVLEIFNVLGQCIAKTQILSGVNEIDGLTVGGVYIVRASGAVAKVVIR